MLMNPAALAGLVAEAEWVELVAGALVLLPDDDELPQPAARLMTAANKAARAR